MKSSLAKSVVFIVAATLICFFAAVPAYAALSTGFSTSGDDGEEQSQTRTGWQSALDNADSRTPEEQDADAIERAKREAAAVESMIDELPDNAGVNEKEKIDAIYKRLNSGYGVGHSATFYASTYVSRDHMEKLEQAKERAENPSTVDQLFQGSGGSGTPTVLLVVLAIWEVICVVQSFLAYGTAYRKTKVKGDNGVSLFGWMLLYDLAALVPGLGFYLWHRSKKV